MEIPEDSAARSFARVVETAFARFQLLKAFIRGDITLASGDLRTQLRAPMQLQHVLAETMVLGVGRIYRALEHGKMHHLVTNEQRSRFMRELRPVVPVRDINEHGADNHKKGGADPTRASMHTHDDGAFALDETSVIILGEDRIMMGPINLADVGRTLEELRCMAGYAALLYPVRPNNTP